MKKTKQKKDGLGNPIAAMATMDTIKSMPNSAKTLVVAGGITLVALLGYALYKLQKGILQKIGIVDTEEEKAVKNFVNTQDYRKAFDANYYKSAPMSMRKLSGAQLIYLAKTIHDAFGFFNDNEERIYGALRQVPTKVDMSRLSEVYFNTYKQDLYGDLTDSLNGSNEMSMVINIIQQKQ